MKNNIPIPWKIELNLIPSSIRWLRIDRIRWNLLQAKREEWGICRANSMDCQNGIIDNFKRSASNSIDIFNNWISDTGPLATTSSHFIGVNS